MNKKDVRALVDDHVALMNLGELLACITSLSKKTLVDICERAAARAMVKPKIHKIVCARLNKMLEAE